MRLTCREAEEMIQCNEREMRQIESHLKDLPKEDLRCARNGKNYKWFCVKEEGAATYLPKSNRKFAEKLALKKYYESQYEELSHQVKALKYYERQMKKVEGKAEDLLKHEEWGKLLEPVVHSVQREDLKIWMEEKHEGGAGYPENLIHKGSQGKYLRSKSEVIIDMMLYKYGIPFRYEDKLILDNGMCIYPDFTVRHPITGTRMYWEHFGLMDDKEYRNNACRKIQLYSDNGIIPSIDLIATFETADHPLDVEKVENIIKVYFL